MPYLASNQDVNDQDIWSKVLVGAGVVIGAAAIGGAVSSHNLTKSMKKQYSKGDVVKDLYGKSAKNIYLGKEGWNNVKARNFKTTKTKDGVELTKGAARYNAGKGIGGKPKLSRTDGNFIQNAWTNYTDKDLRMFNKELKDIYKGKSTGTGDIYSKSKLSLYDHLEKGSRGFNTNTKELGKIVDDIYGSKANKNIRDSAVDVTSSINTKGKERELTGMAQDAKITKDVWGHKYGNDETFNINDYQSGIRPSRTRGKAKASRTATPSKPQTPLLTYNAPESAYEPNFNHRSRPKYNKQNPQPYNPSVTPDVIYQSAASRPSISATSGGSSSYGFNGPVIDVNYTNA